jgi:hypothetical protein
MNHVTLTRFSTRTKLAMLAAMTLAATNAHAVIDVSAVTSGIAEIGVALLAVIGAFLAVSVLILGIGKVYSFVKRKAGG